MCKSQFYQCFLKPVSKAVVVQAQGSSFPLAQWMCPFTSTSKLPRTALTSGSEALTQTFNAPESIGLTHGQAIETPRSLEEPKRIMKSTTVKPQRNTCGVFQALAFRSIVCFKKKKKKSREKCPPTLDRSDTQHNGVKHLPSHTLSLPILPRQPTTLKCFLLFFLNSLKFKKKGKKGYLELLMATASH